jgi:hypothetical protein
MVDLVDDALVLEGLRIIYRRNRGGRSVTPPGAAE